MPKVKKANRKQLDQEYERVAKLKKEAIALQLAAAEEQKKQEGVKEQTEEGNRKLQELAQEVPNQEKRLQELTQEEKRLQELRQEDDKNNKMDVDDGDGGDGAGSEDVEGNGAGSKDVEGKPVESIDPNKEVEALFTSPEPQGADPQGVKQVRIKQESPEQGYMGPEPAIKSELWDEVYGEPLYVAADTQPNYNTPYRRTIAWGGDQKEVINCYGPRNASVYRIIRGEAEGDYAYPREEKYTNPNNRLGDVRRPDGKYLYTHIICLRVVAWKSQYPENPREDLNLIHWDEAMRPVKRFPSTYILVDWLTDHGVQRCWETRATIRNRWGSKRADKSIYQAAYEAEERLKEHLTGTRPALDRSPTPGILYSTSRQFREISGTPAPTGTPAPAVGADNKAILEAALAEFKQIYCELSGVNSFNELNTADKVEWANAWKMERVKYIPIAV